MLSEKHQKMLRDCVRPKKNGEWQSTENLALNEAIAIIREEAPECFHNSRSYGDRVFYDQPHPESRHVVCKDYVKPWKRPIKITKV